MLKLVIVFVLVLGSALAVPLVEADDNYDGRIVGGEDAPIGQYPHQISLRIHNSHYCGGSIISPNWILTAAHCVHGQTVASMEVLVGTNDRISGGVPYRVSQAISHEHYSTQNYAHDIAVVQVSTPIQYNNLVQPISLATSPTPDGLSCVFSGWGITSYPSHDIPIRLQHLSLTSVSLEQCQRAMPGNVFAGDVCTRTPHGKGTCSGDSGGPLLCGGKVQHGVASRVIPCGVGYPDMFASVAYHRNWIRSKTGV